MTREEAKNRMFEVLSTIPIKWHNYWRIVGVIDEIYDELDKEKELKENIKEIIKNTIKEELRRS